MSDQTLNDTPADQAKPLFSVAGREYDAEAAAKKIENADSFIDTLKQESKSKDEQIARLQAELDQKSGLDAKLDEAMQVLRTKESQTVNQPTDTTTTVDMEALQQELIKQAQEAALKSVNQFKQQEVSTLNQTESINAAKARFGSDYETKLREMGSTLGLDDTAINAMASSNPALFKQTFGLNGKPNAGSIYPDGSQASTPVVEKPDLKQVSNHWSSSSKIEAQMSNEQKIAKLIDDNGGIHGGGLEAAEQALGIKLKR